MAFTARKKKIAAIISAAIISFNTTITAKAETAVTEAHLQSYGVSMQEAWEFVNFNLSNPTTIYETSKQYNVTNEMLADIVLVGGITANSSDVKQWFFDRGIDSNDLDGVTLDANGYTAKVGASRAITAGAFTEGNIEADNSLNNSAWTYGWTVNIHGNADAWSSTAAADDSCPAGTTLMANEIRGLDACQLPATISADTQLTNDNVYVLAANGTRVGDGNGVAGTETITGKTLTIDAGTLVVGSEGAYLLVTRGNMINAQGTATAPINFRSLEWANNGVEQRGAWGGIVLQGKGIDFKGTDVQGEGGVEYYGGTNNADNSGTMKYVTITGAGFDIDGQGNELNGLTLQGVGSGTSLSYIQIDMGEDDAIEFFGGAVSVDHIALTDVNDDGFDADNGWKGSASNVFVHMSTTSSKGGPGESRGIEADGYDPKDTNGDKFIDPATGANSQTTVMNLSNFTIVGSTFSDSGLVLRRGVAGTFNNFNVSGFSEDAGMEIRDRGTLEDGTVTDASTGATTWAGTYNRLTFTNTEFADNNKTVKLTTPKDDTAHPANAYADNDAALAEWTALQTGNVDFGDGLIGGGMTLDTNGYTAKVGASRAITAGAFTEGNIEADNSLNNSAWTYGWTVNIHGNADAWSSTAAADDSCPAGTTLMANEIRGLDACQLPATISADTQLTNDNVYVLAANGTRVGDGNGVAGTETITGKTLTIDAGTLVVGSEGAYLLVTRGNMINAQGTATAPINFRSLEWANNGVEQRGAWGGIVLQGKGIDFKGTDVQGEGGVEYYGGTNNADNSGTMKYVTITGAGFDIDGQGNELNGLTLQGVGSGTSLSYIQIDMGEDDAIEFFGGAVSVDHIALTDVNDDGFDADNGWKGSASNVFVHMSTTSSKGGPGESRGIEADGYDPKDTNGDKFIDPATGANSQTTVMNLSNFTIVGSTFSDSGLVLRRGVAGTFNNFNVSGFSEDAGMEIRDRGTLEDGTVTDASTGATTWAGTYNRLTFTNTEFADNNKTVKLTTPKDDTAHPANAYADDAANTAALDAWKAQQTNNVDFGD